MNESPQPARRDRGLDPERTWDTAEQVFRNLKDISPCGRYAYLHLYRGDHVDAQLLGDRSQALKLGRLHPLADISLDGLVVEKDQTSTSSPLVNEVVRLW